MPGKHKARHSSSTDESVAKDGKQPANESTAYAAAAVASGKLLATDLDENVTSFLANMRDTTLTKSAIDDFAEADLSEVKSRSGYLLGMLRQRLRKQKREDKPAKQKRKPDAAVEASKPGPPPKKAKPLSDTPWLTLFVNQLPYSCTQAELAETFATAAGLSAAELLPAVRMLQKNGAFTGTAFVDLPTEEAQQAGLRLDQSYVGKRRINVKPALSKEQLAAQKDVAPAVGAEDSEWSKSMDELAAASKPVASTSKMTSRPAASVPPPKQTAAYAGKRTVF